MLIHFSKNDDDINLIVKMLVAWVRGAPKRLTIKVYTNTR